MKKSNQFKKRAFNKFFPFLSDLVEENVKNRCVFPLVILTVYIILVLTIINTVINVKKYNHIFYFLIFVFKESK